MIKKIIYIVVLVFAGTFYTSFCSKVLVDTQLLETALKLELGNCAQQYNLEDNVGVVESNFYETEECTQEIIFPNKRYFLKGFCCALFFTLLGYGSYKLFYDTVQQNVSRGAVKNIDIVTDDRSSVDSVTHSDEQRRLWIAVGQSPIVDNFGNKLTISTLKDVAVESLYIASGANTSFLETLPVLLGMSIYLLQAFPTTQQALVNFRAIYNEIRAHGAANPLAYFMQHQDRFRQQFREGMRPINPIQEVFVDNPRMYVPSFNMFNLLRFAEQNDFAPRLRRILVQSITARFNNRRDQEMTEEQLQELWHAIKNEVEQEEIQAAARRYQYNNGGYYPWMYIGREFPEYVPSLAIEGLLEYSAEYAGIVRQDIINSIREKVFEEFGYYNFDGDHHRVALARITAEVEEAALEKAVRLYGYNLPG